MLPLESDLESVEILLGEGDMVIFRDRPSQ
jgi:hypothetical protein